MLQIGGDVTNSDKGWMIDALVDRHPNLNDHYVDCTICCFLQSPIVYTFCKSGFQIEIDHDYLLWYFFYESAVC